MLLKRYRFPWPMLVALLMLQPRAGNGFVLKGDVAPEFQSISIEQGLSNDRVNQVFQDSRGFLWISTTDGLNRYDGHEVRVYRHDPNDPRSIAANWISGVAEDAAGDIWVLFGIGGTDRFDRDRELFQHFRSDPAHPNSLPRDDLSSAHLFPDGSFWFGSGAGWIVVERPESVGSNGSRLATDSSHPEVQFRRLTSEDVREREVVGGTLAWLESSGTWIGTTHGLFHRDSSGRNLHCIDTRPTSALALSATGRIWVGRRDGSVALLDPRTRSDELGFTLPTSSSPSAPAPGDPSAREGNAVGIVDLAEDSRGQLWILEASGQLFRYNPSIDRLDSIHVPAFVFDILPDDVGSLALGTSHGFGIYDPTNDRVTLHSLSREPHQEAGVPVAQEPVLHLFEGRSGELWLGTWGAGLERWNERATHFRFDPIERVTALATDESGALWVGTTNGLERRRERKSDWRSGLTDMETSDPLEERDRVLRGAPISALALGDRGLWIASDRRLLLLTGKGELETIWECAISINVLLEDRSGRLWIGTNDSAWQLAPDAETPVRLDASASPLEDALFESRVHALAEGADGRIWFGTYVGGLSALDPTSGRFEHFRFDDEDPSSLNNLSVNTLFVDAGGTLWVGTYSGGLDRFLPESGTFQHLTEREGLAGNQVLGILEDGWGQLWISTNQGLSRLDPETNEFQNFGWNDGLVAQPFELGACASAPDRHLVFGGRGGLIRFDPSQVDTRQTTPSVALTAFRIADTRTSREARRGTDGRLSLGPKEDFLSFDFVGIDFESPERVRYEYRLVGLDTDWVPAGKRSYASYTNLDPGQYEFQARASIDGVSWSAPLGLPLTIRPPFYRTTWFLGAMTALVALLLWGMHRVRVHQQVQRSLLEERIRVAERERVREQVARDYHDEMGHKLAKLGIFSELVQRSVRRLAPDQEAPQIADYAEKIDETVQSLVRDTRDFLWTLDPRRDSVYELAIYMQEFGSRLFAETDVKFRVIGLDDGLKLARLSADWKRQLSLLFKEALTNSLRHADAHRVELRFGIVDDRLEISARDDGVGFDAEASLGRATGGQGLASMKRRAEQLGGRLLVETETGTGTRLRFVAESM